MSTDPVRNLGYVAWTDEDAWMESMRGKRWNAMVAEERQHYRALTSSPAIRREAKQMEQELRDVQQYIEHLPPYVIGDGSIEIHPTTNASRFEWNWTSAAGRRTSALDLDVQGDIVWYITSDLDGRAHNRLVCEDITGKTIWTKSAVSTQIAVIGERCYYITVADYFRTVELCVCHAQTGKQTRVLYKESDEERELVLVKGANHTLYLRSEDPLTSTLYRIDDDGVTIRRLYPRTVRQWALGESIYGEDCVFTRAALDDPWIAHGRPIESWNMGAIMASSEMIWVNLQSGHVLTLKEGGQTIWFCAEGKRPVQVCHVRVGSIQPNVWSWDAGIRDSFLVKTPNRLPFMIHVTRTSVESESIPLEQIKRPIAFAPLEFHRFHAKNAEDGTPVPYVLLHEVHQAKAKAMLVYVYGAYGVTTPINWPPQTWYPLLCRGWAIVFAMIRGGGDMDAAWADAARRDHRHRAVDDYEAVIRDAQRRLRLDPDHTVLYGRSAGGLPVGAMVSRYPRGELMGAAFTEVPYVDVLRTSSNPDLPLTVGEYKEFGNPIEKVMNFQELVKVSPAHTVPPDGAPGVFVLTHVGKLDRQVYAYESFKWIRRLRGEAPRGATRSQEAPKGATRSQEAPREAAGKYVMLEAHEDHEYQPTRLARFRGMDFALLDAWVDQRLRFPSSS